MWYRIKTFLLLCVFWFSANAVRSQNLFENGDFSAALDFTGWTNLHPNAISEFEGDFALFRTGHANVLATLTHPLSVGAGGSYTLQFDFGFSTAEPAAAATFYDSFSVGLYDTAANKSFILLTADTTGTAFAPPTPGAEFFDPDTIFRTITSFPANLAELATSFAYSVVVPAVITNDTTYLYLELFDNENASASLAWVDNFSLFRTETNQPPIATSRTLVLNEDTVAAATLSASDPDNQPLNFTIVDAPLYGQLTGTPPFLTYAPAANFFGIDSFTFKVSDGVDESSLAAVSITVQPVNDAPTIQSISDQSTPATVSSLNVPVTVGDLDTPALSLSAVSDNPALVTGLSFSGTGANRVLAIALNPGQSGSAAITVTVSDGSLTAQASFNLTVHASAPGAAPPIIGSIPAQELMEDSPPVAIGFLVADQDTPLANVSVTAQSSNPALIPAGNMFLSGAGAARTLTLHPVPDAFGTANITVTVNDGTATATSDFTVNVEAVDDLPTLNALGDVALGVSTGPLVLELTGISAGPANENQIITITAVSSDPARVNPTVAYTSPSATGQLTLTPLGAGTVVISVTAADSAVAGHSVTRNFQAVVGQNDPPIILAIPNAVLLEGQQYNHANFVSDRNRGDVIQYWLKDAPEGMTIDPLSGLMQWTPTEGQGGTTNVVILVATDNGMPNLSAAQSFLLVVQEVNAPPVLRELSDVSAVEGSPLKVGLAATDSDQPANRLQFTLAQAPAGMVFDEENQVLLWTPSEADGPRSHEVSVTVTDDGEPSLAQTRTFRIVVEEANGAPVISELADVVLNETSTVSWQVFDGDLPANSLGVSVTSDSTLVVPTLRADETGRAGTIELATTSPQPGQALITLTVNDGVVTVSRSFRVVIEALNAAPVPGDDQVTALEDEPIILTVASLLANDLPGPARERAQGLRLVSVSESSQNGGTLRRVGDTVTYTPPPEFSGSDSFAYTIEDDGTTGGLLDALQATGTVAVQVSAVNDAPVANPDAFSTMADTSLLIPVAQLVGNDVPGPENESAQALVFKSVSPGSTQGGAVRVTEEGVEYTPAAGFNGQDTFTYAIHDTSVTGGMLSFLTATGQVTVAVAPHATLLVERGTEADLVISWPVSPTAFVLEQADDIIAPSWTQVTDGIVPASDRISVRISRSVSTRFFRLRRP